MLWLIKRNFKEIGREAFLLVLLYKHLEYCNFVWAPYKIILGPYIDKLEKVQKLATKMIPEFKKNREILINR